MVASFTDDFSVIWQDASLGQLNWRIERIHFPDPQPPLTQDLFRRIAELGFDARVVFVNGYAFLNNWGIVQAPPEVKERGAAKIWREEYQPRVRAFARAAWEADYDSVPAPELADRIDALFSDAARAYRHTATVILGFMTPGLELTAFCETELGAEGPALAATLLQAFENESAAAGRGLSELAEAAAEVPAVAEALKAGRLSDLESLPEARAFLARLQSFLDEYGRRAEGWTHLHRPTWAEDKAIPLDLIARYLRDPERAPAVSMRRSAEQREQAAQIVEGRLSEDKRDTFRALYDAAKHHIPISEERAHWQLTLTACPRPAVLALGRKLVASGVLEQPEDVFFLSLEELKQLAQKPTSTRDLVTQRKAELSRWQGLKPPEEIGGPFTPPPDFPGRPHFVRYFLGIGAAAVEGQVIKGLAASRGKAQGVARVLKSLDEGGRLQPGDILVCRTTSPPWTPLFAIAGAVVTDSGGILTHSAICAREYGIPCVVGTRYATASIPDGALITVDGTNGTVTIEP